MNFCATIPSSTAKGVAMRYIEPVSRGAFCQEGVESKDCAVRAMCNASGMDYDDAHEILAYYGRPDRKGTKHDVLFAAYQAAGFRNIEVFGTTKPARFYARKYGDVVQNINEGITLKNFCKKYNKGRYIVVYAGHALAVVNGEVIDNGLNPANKRIVLVFKKVEKFGE
jgi:hypothetical protein